MADSSEGQDLTAAERNAVVQAMSALEAHTSNPRIEALHSKLNATRNPTDFSGDADADDRVAKRASELAAISKAELDLAYAGELSTEDHMRTTSAVRKAQESYLESMGSGAGRQAELERARAEQVQKSMGGRPA